MKNFIVDLLVAISFVGLVIALFLSGANDLTIIGYKIANGCLFASAICSFGVAFLVSENDRA